MRKRRTREHIIADLSVNYVERFVLRQGHTAERLRADYGYDLSCYTYNEEGEVENGAIYIQLKATDHLRRKSEGREVAFTVEVRDLDLWTSETMPVYLIVYDAVQDTAYWLDVQRYLSTITLPPAQANLTLTIDANNILTEVAVESFRQRKNEANLNVQRRIRNED